MPIYLDKFQRLILLSLITLPLWSTSCKEEEEKDNLILSRNEIAFPSEGDTITVLLQTDAEEWKIQNPTDWVSINPVNGTGQTASIDLIVKSKSAEARNGEITVLAGNANPFILSVSQEASEFLYALSSIRMSFDFKRSGSAQSLDLESDAPAWTISSEAAWLSFSLESGGEGEFEIKVTTETNSNSEAREATIKIEAEYAPSIEIQVSQIGEYYPDYNISPKAADETGMESTATQLAAKMGIGWNIGNTLEATGGETAWGNPQVTDALIKLVKANGFSSIRIPCSWNQNANPITAEIDQAWLSRVKQVVTYCMNNDMYAVLNIHWDGGWLENNVNADKQEANNAKQKAFWQQIATEFRDFDEKLIFAGANEPNVENAAQMSVLMSYHQTFIDAVRATGGKNAYRVLVVQGPSTDVEKTNELMKNWPTDQVPNKLMAEVHYYTPYQFCLMEADADWGEMFYYWGANYHSIIDPQRNATWGEEATVDQMIQLMHDQFIRKGIPVILGEYGVVKRTSLQGSELELHLASRAYYLNYFTKKCKEKGLIPFYWDTGSLGAMTFTLFNRNNNTIFDTQALDAIIKGSKLEGI